MAEEKITEAIDALIELTRMQKELFEDLRAEELTHKELMEIVEIGIKAIDEKAEALSKKISPLEYVRV